MIIDALFESKKSLYRYDADTGRLLFSQNERLFERLTDEGVDSRAQAANLMAGAIYECERCRTHYSSGGKTAINQRMRTQSVLFGKPRLRCTPQLEEASDPAVADCVFEAIRFVFRNNAITSWAIKDLGPGVRRVYPSNGAVHSLECRYTDRHGHCFLYDSYHDRFFVIHDATTIGERPGKLVIQCDFERLAERYRDVRSLSALYIELGHSIAALFHALQVRNKNPVSLELSGFKPTMNYCCSSMAIITL
ncbi:MULTISPECIES: hypothetical protein [unclassified Pseudomonas]|jgi:hypothetical protein|uniref:hypothetical protein n=1 Tax=unclassified Pseudomonas TaxID=196821 RepID=UPI00098A12C4|nr:MULTISPECIES: hypothetical protein [unclassified Pseudomonas]OOL36152.1 hypothetical protein BOO94_20120 [Pseudomonas sp. FSL W5-0299]TWC22442.1 hypothetical protein FBY05_107237 [Pseudomonas sp. SJZ083]TWC48572.1 hypothetical protein FBY01_10726 [Pseudomonas sp. SJZ077]